MLLPKRYLGSLLHMEINENHRVEATGLDNSGKLNNVLELLEDANWCPPIVILDRCIVKENREQILHQFAANIGQDRLIFTQAVAGAVERSLQELSLLENAGYYDINYFAKCEDGIVFVYNNEAGKQLIRLIQEEINERNGYVCSGK